MVATVRQVHYLYFARAPVRLADCATRKGDRMIPSQRHPEDDQTLSDLVQSCADCDQRHSDSDQTRSDRDQGAADLDQEAADHDQAASDRALVQGVAGGAYDSSRVAGEAYDSSREARERATLARRETSSERHHTAIARDAAAHKRDLSALTRDRAAGARDIEDDQRDAEIASLISFSGSQPAAGGGQIILRAAGDREQAASHRARSATRRADARRDRDRGASDRLVAADDRVRAAEDRAHATSERDAHEVEVVTGATRRGPGLAELQREIDRANRGNGQLIVAYVDVEDLKATNDSEGRQAGDLILKHIVNVLKANLYVSVVRLSGDAFACAVSDTTIENVRHQFEKITAELSLKPADGSISVGFAELVRGDSPMDLIDRADRRLTASRDTQTLAVAGPEPEPTRRA
jgi:diguanylate cyclase (GGDEF)-like protein